MPWTVAPLVCAWWQSTMVKAYSLQTLREHSYITREGVSLLGTSDAAESIGFRTMGVKISFEQLVEEVPLPCIAHWKQNHFVVVYKIAKQKRRYLPPLRGSGGQEWLIYIADPAEGLVKLNENEFKGGWISTKSEGKEKGVCLLLEPSPDFYSNEDEKPNKASFKFLFSYLRPYKKFLIQLFLGLLAGSLLQLIFPFLTQSIVDFGIANRDIGFVYLVVIAQLMLFTGRTAIDFIRGWILLHISTRINISLISDFLIKLMKLPIRFFDIKMIGDLMQRIGDHTRIEKFLTSTSLDILFSVFNLAIHPLYLLIMSKYPLHETGKRALKKL